MIITEGERQKKGEEDFFKKYGLMSEQEYKNIFKQSKERSFQMKDKLPSLLKSSQVSTTASGEKKKPFLRKSPDIKTKIENLDIDLKDIKTEVSIETTDVKKKDKLLEFNVTILKNKMWGNAMNSEKTNPINLKRNRVRTFKI